MDRSAQLVTIPLTALALAAGIENGADALGVRSAVIWGVSMS